MTAPTTETFVAPAYHESLHDCAESFAVAHALGMRIPAYSGSLVYRLFKMRGGEESSALDTLHSTPEGAWRALGEKYLLAGYAAAANILDPAAREAEIRRLLVSDPQEAILYLIRTSRGLHRYTYRIEETVVSP